MNQTFPQLGTTQYSQSYKYGYHALESAKVEYLTWKLVDGDYLDCDYVPTFLLCYRYFLPGT